LAICLRSIEPQLEAYPTEVIVSDDGRDAQLATEIASRFPFARYFVGPARGPAANRNHGARQAKGEWLVFCDDDCRPEEGWIQAFASAAQSVNSPVLEGKTIADRPRERLDEEAPINETGGYLWSCNFAIRRELFEDIGGFDEDFPYAAMEDVDLKTRLVQDGHSIAFVEAAVCVHPWRRIKEIKFQQKRLQSLAYLWNKHPSLRPKHTRWWLVLRGLRELKNHLLPNLMRCRGKGLPSASARALSFVLYALRF